MRISSKNALEITRNCIRDRMGAQYITVYGAFSTLFKEYIRMEYPFYQVFVREGVKLGVDVHEVLQTPYYYNLHMEKNEDIGRAGTFPRSSWGTSAFKSDILENPFSGKDWDRAEGSPEAVWMCHASLCDVKVTDAYYCSSEIPYRKESSKCRAVFAARKALCDFAEKVVAQAEAVYSVVISFSTTDKLIVAVPDMKQYLPETVKKAEVPVDVKLIDQLKGFLGETRG